MLFIIKTVSCRFLFRVFFYIIGKKQQNTVLLGKYNHLTINTKYGNGTIAVVRNAMET